MNGMVISDVKVVRDTISARVRLFFPSCSAMATGATAVGKAEAKTMTAFTSVYRKSIWSTIKKVIAGITSMAVIVVSKMYLFFRMFFTLLEPSCMPTSSMDRGMVASLSDWITSSSTAGGLMRPVLA